MPSIKLPSPKILAGGAVAALLLVGLTAWWTTDKSQSPAPQAQLAATAMPAAATPEPITPPPATEQAAVAPVPVQAEEPASPATATTAPATSLFDQRLAAGKKMLAQKNAAASIQLFSTEDLQPKRVEGFLKRAEGLGKLQQIYLVPARFGDKEGLRVLYGAYPTVEAARNAIKDLPPRYQESFATAIHVF